MVQSADYHNAGTVEFIVDKDHNFYFIEVNARIQVEHPVSEMVTGIDLIKQQILVATGEKLPFKQKDIECNGSAIECRINAEDPAHDFRPSPGKIDHLFLPGGLGVRFDTHIHAGYSVPPFYDSMIGKLIVHRKTREESIECTLRALSELNIGGIATTVPFLMEVLQHKDFAEGKMDTTWVERNK